MRTIKQTFDDAFKDVVFDKKLGLAVEKYILTYLHGSKDNLEFFSSNLLGIQPIRYTDRQVLKLFDDVLDVDYFSLSEEVTKIPSINQEFKVVSDVFNLTIVYMTHRFLTSKLLKPKEQEEYSSISMSIFYYRTLAALIASRFKFTADRGIVEAAYGNLSNKYLIKKLGNWNKVVNYRTENVLAKSSKHYKTFQTFDKDDKVLYILSDSQGSINTLVKTYYSEIVNAKENGERLHSNTNTVTDLEGTDVLKDRIGGIDNYVKHFQKLVSEKDNLIRDDLVHILLDINKNAMYNQVCDFLLWMADNYEGKRVKDVDRLIETTIVFSFEYLAQQRPDVKLNDFALLLVTIKNAMMSSRNKDPVFLEMKELSNKLLLESGVSSKNKNIQTGNRTVILLYMTFRTLVDLN